MVKELTSNYSHSVVYRHVVGSLPSCAKIRDCPCLEDSHIIEVALMDKGIFMLKLSTMEYTSSLVAHSLYVVDRKILSFVSWYRGFRALDFDTQFHSPHFPATLLFPGLAKS